MSYAVIRRLQATSVNRPEMERSGQTAALSSRINGCLPLQHPNRGPADKRQRLKRGEPTSGETAGEVIIDQQRRMQHRRNDEEQRFAKAAVDAVPSRAENLIAAAVGKMVAIMPD